MWPSMPRFGAPPFVALGLALLALSTLRPSAVAATEPTPKTAYGDKSARRPRVVIAGNPDAADFVVIGGGTAGCVLATRLCQTFRNSSVVLLERGPPRNESQQLQVQALRLGADTWQDPDMVETIVTDPNPGLGGRVVTQVTGSTLGGSSAINAGQWTRPALATFDEPQWAFAGVPPVLPAGPINMQQGVPDQIQQDPVGSNIQQGVPDQIPDHECVCELSELPPCTTMWI